jgi:peptide/nickel transport system substrate-binding protein
MARSPRSSVVAALLLALALVGAACAGQGDGGEEPTAGEPQKGGTLTIAAEQFPADTQCYGALNNIAWCWYMTNPAIFGAFRQTPEFGFEPELLEGEPEIDEGPPFTVTYRIHPDATWSDGTPVTAQDFEFSWKGVYINPKADVVGRDGYDDIKSAEIIDDKTIKFTFKTAFAPWKTLFSPIYPKHVLQGENWNKVWDECICDPETGEPIGSGPFLVTEFKENQSLTLERNPNWWGPRPAYLDRVVFRYIPDTNSEIQAIRGGEVDIIYPTWQLPLKGLQNASGLEYQVDSGTFFQHLDLQFKTPPLDKLFVRQAIFYGIDRESIVDKLVRPGQPDAEVLENLIYVANSPYYEPHFDIYGYDPDKATQLLEDNGCKKGSDGIYACDGTKLSFAYKSTADNELRELMFQIIQANLKDIGIEVTNAFGEADVVFTELSKKDYEVFQFGWVGSPDPFSGSTIYKCKGDQNYQDYCNRRVDELLERSNTELDPPARAEIWNQVDQLLAEDAVSVPLWQAPQPLIYKDTVHGLEVNATQQGIIWEPDLVWMESEGT